MAVGIAYPLAGMFGVQVVASVANFAVPVLATEMAPDVGLPATSVGFYSAIVYTGTMVAGLVAGSFIAGQGAVRTAQLALLAAIAAMLLATASTPLAIAAAALLIGTCYGPVGPAGSHLLARVTEPRWRPLVFSVKQTGVTAGGLLAAAILPTIALEYGWRMAFVAVGAASVLMLIAVQPLRRLADTDRQAGHRVAPRDLLVSLRLAFTPSLRHITFSSVGFSISQSVLSAFFVVFLVDSLKLPLPQAGLVFAVVQIAGTSGRILWGLVAEQRYSAQQVLALLAFVIAGCFGALSFMTAETPLWLMLTLAAVLGMSAYGWNGVMLAEWTALAPDGRVAEATGGVQFVMFGGSVAAPPLVGMIVGTTGGYSLAFALVVAVALANGLLLVSGLRRRDG